MHTTTPNTEIIQKLQQVRHLIWQTVQDGLRGPKMVGEEAGLHPPMREEDGETHAWLKLDHLVRERRALYAVPLAIMFG